MKIKQSVINTFNRIGLDYKAYADRKDKVEVKNWITKIPVETTPLIAQCVWWVYQTSLEYEHGVTVVKLSDFDRIRYFILEQDPDVYMNCID